MNWGVLILILLVLALLAPEILFIIIMAPFLVIVAILEFILKLFGKSYDD